jgi:hypothetical protein
LFALVAARLVEMVVSREPLAEFGPSLTFRRGQMAQDDAEHPDPIIARPFCVLLEEVCHVPERICVGFRSILL